MLYRELPTRVPNGSYADFDIGKLEIYKTGSGKAAIKADGTVVLRSPLHRVVSGRAALGEMGVDATAFDQAVRDARQLSGAVNVPDIYGIELRLPRKEIPTSASFRVLVDVDREGTQWRVEKFVSATINPAGFLEGTPGGEVTPDDPQIKSKKSVIDDFMKNVGEETKRKSAAAQPKEIVAPPPSEPVKASRDSVTVGIDSFGAVRQFVREFVRVGDTNQVEEILSFYSYPVKYFDDGNVGMQFVRDDVEKYDIRWPVRRNEIDGEVEVSEVVSSLNWKAAFTSKFYVESAERGEWVRGRVRQTCTIQKIDGAMKIIEIKADTLQREKGISSGSTRPSSLSGKWEGTIRQKVLYGATKGMLTDRQSEITIDEQRATISFGGGKTVAFKRNGNAITWTFDGRSIGRLNLGEDGQSATLQYLGRNERGIPIISSEGMLRKVR